MNPRTVGSRPVDAVTPWDYVPRYENRPPPWRRLLVERHLRLTAQRTPNTAAVVCGESRLTWRELDEMADRAADGLLRTAARPGDVIGLSSPNRPETLAMMFGIARAGMTVLPLNPMSTANEIAFQMEDVDATILLSDGGLSVTEVIAAGRPKVPDIEVKVLRWRPRDRGVRVREGDNSGFGILEHMCCGDYPEFGVPA